jgi:hypothetical protein
MAIATKPSFIPTLKKAAAPVPPVTPVAAPVVAEPVTVKENVEEIVMSEEAVAPVTEKKEKVKRTTAPNREMVPEDMLFIIANIKTMSYSQMADARGLTKHQVNRVLMTVKQQMIDACVLTRDEEGKPLTFDENALATVKAYIAENLSRPEGSRPGQGGGRSSVVKDSISTITNDILANILNAVK